MAKSETATISDSSNSGPTDGNIDHSAITTHLDTEGVADAPVHAEIDERAGHSSLEESYQLIKSFDYANTPLQKSEIRHLEEFLEALATEQEQEREFSRANRVKARLRRKGRETVELKMPFAETGESSGGVDESMHRAELTQDTLANFQDSETSDSPFGAGYSISSSRRASSTYDKKNQQRAPWHEDLATLEKVRRQSESSSPETDPDFESDSSHSLSTSNLEINFDLSLEEELAGGSISELSHEVEADIDEHRLTWIRERELESKIAAVVERMVWNANQGIIVGEVEEEEAARAVEVVAEVEVDVDGGRQELQEILLAATAHLAILAAAWALMGTRQ